MLYIEPGSPWKNGNCETFKSKLRDEFLNGAPLDLDMPRIRPPIAPHGNGRKNPFALPLGNDLPLAHDANHRTAHRGLRGVVTGMCVNAVTLIRSSSNQYPTRTCFKAKAEHRDSDYEANSGHVDLRCVAFPA